MEEKTYQVVIDPVDTTRHDGTILEDILEYRHEGGGVFYFAGTDFEHWFILKPGQVVQVTEEV